MAELIDTFNRHMVSASGENVVILNPPCRPMTKDSALLLAAWLVALADDGERFAAVLEAVRNT